MRGGSRASFGHTRQSELEYFGQANPSAFRLPQYDAAERTRGGAVPMCAILAKRTRACLRRYRLPERTRGNEGTAFWPNEPKPKEMAPFRPMAATPWQRALAILGKQTRAAAERREFACVVGRVSHRSRLAWLRWRNPPPLNARLPAAGARCILWRTRLPATASRPARPAQGPPNSGVVCACGR